MQNNVSNISLSLDTLIERSQVTSLRAFIYYLAQIWRDLAHHSFSSKNKGISRVVFSKYYDLPGIISARLFSVFDKSNRNCLSPKEFIEGMLILFSESMKTLTKFIFNFYDFNNDGLITKEDVRIVLSYVPLSLNYEEKVKTENKLFSILSKTFGSGETLTLSQFQNITEAYASEVFAYLILFLLKNRPFTTEALALYDSKDISKNSKASIHISRTQLSSSTSSLNNFGQTLSSTKIRFSSLSFCPDFYSDIDIGSFAIKLKQSLNGNYNSNHSSKEFEEKNSSIVYKSSTFGRKTTQEELGVIIEDMFQDKVVELKAEEEDRINEDYDGLNKAHEGYLYKVTTTSKLIKRMWFKLLGKDLFFYKRKEGSLFKGMHNLSGSYIKENEPFKVNDTTVYSFSVIYLKTSRTYYNIDLEDNKKWIRALKAITNSKKLEEDYELKTLISKGKFSLVYYGIQKKTSKAVAIKLLDKTTMNSKDLELVKSEIDILKICQHPNIIKLCDVFETENTIYIITEYYSGGDLCSYVQKNGLLPEKKAAEIIHKISLAVYFIHSFGIVHRDLKLNNILLSNKSEQADVIMLDFGLSTIIGPGEKCTDSYGTLYYAAPEVLDEIPYDQKADLWSIGIISYVLLTGKFPFGKEKSGDKLIKAILKEEVNYSIDEWKRISPEGKAFVKQLLQKDHKKRMGIKDLLLHDWIKKYYERSTIQRKNNPSVSSLFKFYTAIEEKDVLNGNQCKTQDKDKVGTIK